jgi:hypothetical protein
MSTKPFVPPAFDQHFQQPPPDILYHYTTQAGLIGIIENVELWATKVQYLNDASEFTLALDMMRRALERAMSRLSTPSEKAAAAELSKSLAGLEDINICAASFCENGDLLSQWRGYAGSGGGYAVGLHTDRLTQIAERNNFALGRCIYDVETQQKIVEQVVHYCIENETDWNADRRWGFHGPLAELLFKYGAYFKHAKFAEEAEWRLVSHPVLYAENKLRFRIGRSNVVPYCALPIAHEDGSPIQKVTVGPCPHRDEATRAVTSLLTANGFKEPLNGWQLVFASDIPYRNW